MPRPGITSPHKNNVNSGPPADGSNCFHSNNGLPQLARRLARRKPSCKEICSRPYDARIEYFFGVRKSVASGKHVAHAQARLRGFGRPAPQCLGACSRDVPNSAQRPSTRRFSSNSSLPISPFANRSSRISSAKRARPYPQRGQAPWPCQ